MLPAKAIEVCRANKWLKTRPYVRANGRRQMVRLTSQVGGNMVINAIFLKGGVTQIGPQHCHHAQLVRTFKSRRNFFNLAT